MKDHHIIYDMVFDANFHEIYKIFTDFLIDFQKVKPDKWVWYELNDLEEKEKKIYRADFLDLIDSWENKQISYGYFEIHQIYCNSETPMQVKMFCSEKKYLGYWLSIQYRLIENLKLYDGTLPDKVEPWMLIDDNGYDRQLIKLLHMGYTAEESARRLHISPRTVYNRESELRKIYKEKIVPKRKDVKKRR